MESSFFVRYIKPPIKRFLVSPARALSEEIWRRKWESTLAFQGQAASDFIKSLIAGTSPAMICRLGTGELNTISLYRRILKGKSRFVEGDYSGLDEIAGFFPISRPMIEKYYYRMLQDIQIIDVLGSWLKKESEFRKELKGAKKCPLPDLEPYYHDKPWSAALTGRKVLVIHPFEKSIRDQYTRRRTLFRNADVLPEFELLTLRAVQSLGTSHDRTKYHNWFEALQWMEEEISRIDFEVAIIGCGAYGLPLAAHVKRLKKKAVHLGGATQILFGIKGNRWEHIEATSGLFNENWIRPREEERPDNYRQIEGGSYW